MIGFDLFHRVAEKVDAHGVFLVDREDVEDVAAQGEVALPVHGRGAHIAERDQLRGQGIEVDFFPLPQRERADGAGKELQEALDVAHGDARAPLHAVQRVQATEERVARDRFLI